uniref:Uncharacterized protein n=1 Tax=Rhizophora mucronata TaxID=61149 RepID=A0A2P2PZQ9_RHIMU
MSITNCLQMDMHNTWAMISFPCEDVKGVTTKLNFISINQLMETTCFRHQGI